MRKKFSKQEEHWVKPPWQKLTRDRSLYFHLFWFLTALLVPMILPSGPQLKIRVRVVKKIHFLGSEEENQKSHFEKKTAIVLQWTKAKSLGAKFGKCWMSKASSWHFIRKGHMRHTFQRAGTECWTAQELKTGSEQKTRSTFLPWNVSWIFGTNILNFIWIAHQALKSNASFWMINYQVITLVWGLFTGFPLIIVSQNALSSNKRIIN